MTSNSNHWRRREWNGTPRSDLSLRPDRASETVDPTGTPSDFSRMTRKRAAMHGGPFSSISGGAGEDSVSGGALVLEAEEHHPATAARLHVGCVVDVLGIHGSSDDLVHVVQVGNRVVIEP